MAGISFSDDVVPAAAMVTVEVMSVGLSTIFKAATLEGMSYYVFIFYSYVVAALVLLPLVFFFPRPTTLPPFNCNVFCRIFLLAMIGVFSQVLGYAGINYSSPTMASAIGNLSPAFTFILAVLLRMEKLDLGSSVSLAKITGTLLSISGAFVVVFYKGPTILQSNSDSLHLPILNPVIDQNWIMGGLLLTCQCLMVSVWYIVQTQIMKIYPAEMLVVLIFSICCMFISLPVGLVGETNLDAWRLRLDLALAAILYSGVIWLTFSTVVHTWGLRIKGPVYISIFKPLSIVIAAFMTVLFLGEKLCLGSVIGAALISIGFYAVLWGKAKEIGQSEDGGSGSICKHETPLLKDHTAAEA